LTAADGKSGRIGRWGWIAAFTLLTAGCGLLRSEFYREETQHLYREAAAAYRSGNAEAAAATFGRILQLDPQHGCAHAALGNLALANGDYAPAAAHYRRALAADADLETLVRPNLLRSLYMERQAPLAAAGVRLEQIAGLVAEGRFRTLDAALAAPSVPIERLAADSGLLTQAQLAVVLRSALAGVAGGAGSPRCRLFLAWLLHHHHVADRECAAALGDLPARLEGADRASAFMLQGRLLERIGRRKRAAQGYLAAYAAGRPVEAVARRLAPMVHLPVTRVVHMLQTGSRPAADPAAVRRRPDHPLRRRLEIVLQNPARRPAYANRLKFPTEWPS
jgi:tetratricopeptide (TPR) repeat protein